MDALATSGFQAAAAYEEGRPGYAPEAVAAVVKHLGLSQHSTVLDLAAGTGQLARVLVPRVASVLAVEPSAPMRRVLAERVPPARVLAGAAESLPLEDESVDAVVVGEAFHWFDGDAAVREIARVLRPRGGVGLLWNVVTDITPAWPAELDDLLNRHRNEKVPDEQRYSSGHWRRAFDGTDSFGPLTSGSAEHTQTFDRSASLAQIASWSYIGSLPEDVRLRVLEDAGSLLPSAAVVTYRTDFYWAQRSAQ